MTSDGSLVQNDFSLSEMAKCLIVSDEHQRRFAPVKREEKPVDLRSAGRFLRARLPVVRSRKCRLDRWPGHGRWRPVAAHRQRAAPNGYSPSLPSQKVPVHALFFVWPGSSFSPWVPRYFAAPSIHESNKTTERQIRMVSMRPSKTAIAFRQPVHAAENVQERAFPASRPAHDGDELPFLICKLR